jgi:methionyl aminopeptidase
MLDNSIILKTPPEIKKMEEGGKKLANVKKQLMLKVGEGVSAAEIEDLADKLIKKEGGEPSFKMVPGYHWATCVNVNEGIVHGIPKKEIVFKKGDIVSVDLGIKYQGFHTDTSFSVAISPTEEVKKFLRAGEEALQAAIKKARPGNRIYDISEAIEKTLKKYDLNPVKVLVGHGIGRDLHEAPQIPGFTKNKREQTPRIEKGAVFAIEVIYTKGSPEISLDEDGWTIKAKDGKITGLFEETVAITSNGPIVLTKVN